MWQVVGQDKSVKILQRGLERGTLAHAYMLAGPPHVGKMTVALNLAQALNCESPKPPCGQCQTCQKVVSGNHADVQIIGLTQNGDAAGAKLISIDQVRDMQHSASLPPFEGKCKVFIIEGAELLSVEAANCLLKTLEEPTDKVVFLLLTTNEKLLPATVVSRCQRLELTPLPSPQMEEALQKRWGIEPQLAKLLSRLSKGCLGWAVTAASDDRILPERAERLEHLYEVIRADTEARFSYAAQLAAQFAQNKAAVQEILDLWRDWWRDLLLVKTGCSDYVAGTDQSNMLNYMAEHYTMEQIRCCLGSIMAAERQLRQNANPRLVLEVLMLDMPGKAGKIEAN
ncbi:MAG TPA: DNA polymerase III subunit delta' C-terminal domain-containing protein [Dehalococcoidales bacterium]|nr:DNA polymerase III subunit delta' C-terminal domain-containing protein [Dehalococcoidales bacterium]